MGPGLPGMVPVGGVGNSNTTLPGMMPVGNANPPFPGSAPGQGPIGQGPSMPAPMPNAGGMLGTGLGLAALEIQHADKP